MYNAAGYHAFVVQYRVHPHLHPLPLRDAARALRIVRSHAAEWGVKKDKIAVCGFSAGGHLAGSLSIFFDETVGDHDDLSHISARPDASILCYSVISCAEFAHQGSFNQLLGEGALENERCALSLELQVHEHVPPAFLWSTVEDTVVPVENTLAYAQALRRHNILHEMHVYPRGGHGMGLATSDPHVATWAALSCAWLETIGF